MSIITKIRSRPLLWLAYLLFVASMLLPTFAIDLGNNGNPVQPGYKVFLGGPVGALGIIAEPGGEAGNRVLGIYYLCTWLANFALLLPFLTILSATLRRVFAAAFTVLAWSIIASFFLIDDMLISGIGIGYYLWSLAITLVLFDLMADHGETVPD